MEGARCEELLDVAGSKNFRSERRPTAVDPVVKPLEAKFLIKSFAPALWRSLPDAEPQRVHLRPAGDTIASSRYFYIRNPLI
jgi:hypothetical protein